MRRGASASQQAEASGERLVGLLLVKFTLPPHFSIIKAVLGQQRMSRLRHLIRVTWVLHPPSLSRATCQSRQLYQ